MSEIVVHLRFHDQRNGDSWIEEMNVTGERKRRVLPVAEKNVVVMVIN